MSGPDLPDTDDPFELLGVDESATDRDIKRAYVRLIKKFRPERDRDAFMRIHSAYESAVARAKWARFEALSEDDGAGDEPATDDDDSGDGDSDEVEPAQLPKWHQQVLACAERDDIVGAVDGLAAAMAAHEPGAGVAAFEILTVDPLLALVARDEYAWANLREQDNRWAALELFGLRVDEMLFRTDSRIIDEVGSELYLRDALSDKTLDRFALDVVRRAAWEVDPRAPMLLEKVGSTAPSQDVAYYYRIASIFRIAKSWQRFRAEVGCPPSFERLVVLFSSVGSTHRAKLLDAVDRDLRERPELLLRALDGLAAVNEELLLTVHDMLSEIMFDREVALEDLSDDEQSFIEGKLRDADLDLRQGRSLGSKIISGAAAGGALVLLPTPYNYVGSLGILMAVGFWHFLPDNVSYRDNARPGLVTIVAQTGIEPRRIVEWIEKRARLRNRFRLGYSVEVDVPLTVFGRLARLCLSWRSNDHDDGDDDEPDEPNHHDIDRTN